MLSASGKLSWMRELESERGAVADGRGEGYMLKGKPSRGLKPLGTAGSSLR